MRVSNLFMNWRDILKKIIDYYVLETPLDGDEIGALVSKAISEGWQPFGSLQVLQYEDKQMGACYEAYQAMVKYE